MTIRTVDPNCRECGRPLTDDLARRRRVGPDCWARMTPAEQQHALELAAAERDPFHIPAPRPATLQARVNNHNARATTTPDAVQLCHHEAQIGRCGDCRREADPWRAVELIVRHVTAQPREQRARNASRSSPAGTPPSRPGPPHPRRSRSRGHPPRNRRPPPRARSNWSCCDQPLLPRRPHHPLRRRHARRAARPRHHR
ncbi:DUF6011 domain-containing protein [Actinomadura sp. CNU-125]|uniref:DUF6011 domain-containing protein n=1 Tax=Actinomadura sp. CNU-125 TaxID=1904961 RepID=UPI003966AA04